MSHWNERETKSFFQKLLFYNVLIEKPKIRGLKKDRFTPRTSFL